jgi:hypothetical protein
MNRRPRKISKGCMKVEETSMKNFEERTSQSTQQALGGDKQFQQRDLLGQDINTNGF